MSIIARALWNPIVAKEYRSRMRSWRSPLALMIYILMIGGLGWAIFAAMASSSSSSFGGPTPNYGQTLFMYLVIFQMVLLAFVTPALTAGAISGERERQTIDLLFVTLVPPFSIIWGKLLASISFILLLLLLSVPIFSLVFLFGGIELDQVLYSFVVMGVTALMLGTIGIAFSTWLRRTLPATVAAYATAFVLMAGSLLYGFLFPTIADPLGTVVPAPPVVTYLGPIVPLLTIATNAPVAGPYGVRYSSSTGLSSNGGGACATNGAGMKSCVSTAAPGPTGVSGGPSFTPAAQDTGATLPSGPFRGWQYWQASVAMQLAVCVLALLLSALLLPPVRRLRWPGRTGTRQESLSP
jgi:ABC-type transport system involved in multi-copper enzyme maturation permease subunit